MRFLSLYDQKQKYFVDTCFLEKSINTSQRKGDGDSVRKTERNRGKDHFHIYK